jgi:ATP-dependent RNA helicase DeaD
MYRVEVGRTNGVQPGNLVGAIANEAGVASSNIGRIEIFDAYSTIELPEGMPKDIFQLLKKVWVSGRQLEITKVSGTAGGSVAPRTRPTKKYDSSKKHSDAPPKPKKPKKLKKLKLVAPTEDA